MRTCLKRGPAGAVCIVKEHNALGERHELRRNGWRSLGLPALLALGAVLVALVARCLLVMRRRGSLVLLLSRRRVWWRILPPIAAGVPVLCAAALAFRWLATLHPCPFLFAPDPALNIAVGEGVGRIHGGFIRIGAEHTVHVHRLAVALLDQQLLRQPEADRVAGAKSTLLQSPIQPIGAAVVSVAVL